MKYTFTLVDATGRRLDDCIRFHTDRFIAHMKTGGSITISDNIETFMSYFPIRTWEDFHDWKLKAEKLGLTVEEKPDPMDPLRSMMRDLAAQLGIEFNEAGYDETMARLNEPDFCICETTVEEVPEDAKTVAYGLEGNVMTYGDLPDNNAKTVAGLGKPRFDTVPAIAWLALGEAMQDGARKYGPFNWRDDSITVSVFQNALMRHFIDYFLMGETFAPDSKVHHLAHLMAGCAILLDAQAYDVVNDDRDELRDSPYKNIYDLMKIVRQQET
jgi:hypothetical protein